MGFDAYGIAIIPIIVGLIQVVKKFGLPSKLAPLVSLLLGMIAGFVYLAPDNPKKAILYGLVAGLSAVGLYSGGKSTITRK